MAVNPSYGELPITNRQSDSSLNSQYEQLYQKKITQRRCKLNLEK